MSTPRRAALWAPLFLCALLLVLLCGLPLRAQDRTTTRVDLRNLPVTGAAPVLTSSVGAGNAASVGVAYRVTVYVVGTNSVFNVDYGTDLAPVAMNGGTALTAGVLYTFTFAATTNDALNFTFTTTTTLGRLIVEEIRGGAL